MKRVLAFLGAVALVLGAEAAASGSTTNPALAVHYSAAQARSIALSFAGGDVADQSAAAVSGPFDASDHRYYQVDGGAFRANIDAFDGHVRTFALPAALPASADVSAVSKDEALSIAAAFLSARGVATQGLSPRVELVNHGSFAEYDVIWDLRINGALVPDERTVSVNPQTGQVFGYENFSAQYEPPAVAQVDRAQAVAIAERLLGVTSARVAGEDLQVIVDPSGAQRLVWTLSLGDLPPSGGAALVQVDAITGSAQVVARG